MRTDRAIPRRRLLQELGKAVAVAAVAPSLLGLAGHGAPVVELHPAPPEDVGMSPDRLEDVFARLARRVGDKLIPGAVALVARKGAIVGHRAFGTKVRDADEPVTLDTLFDVQSMTKVLSTAIAAMVLADRGVIQLDEPVAKYLPDFAANGKGGVTLRDMLRYSAGLPLDNQALDNPDQAAVWKMMAETPLEYAPGSAVLYSDLTYRLLGRVLEAAAGMNLDALAKQAVWGPLGMNDTTYNPPVSLRPRVAATGFSERRGYLVRGEVQDEQDFALGGITGCDGVFTTAMDVAIFCQMVLNRGRHAGGRVLSPHTAREMVKNQTPHADEVQTDQSPLTNLLQTPKGYGWERWTRRFSNGGMRLSPGSFGKCGGAGTVMWIDPERELIGVLLTNHGLPIPFDEIGWNRLLDNIGTIEFFDGIVNAIDED